MKQKAPRDLILFMRKKIFSYLGYTLFVVFIVAASLELASQIYIHHFRSDLLQLSYEEENPFEVQKMREWHANFKLSPYFGYVTKYGNNYGFSSSDDYPLLRVNNTFVIAVLGGSVADQFARHIVANYRLTEKLKSLIPNLKDKDIRFMNLAIPGYKQPQQYIALSYFIDDIDMIIQLDGWNEIWSRTSESYPFNFPSFSEFLYNEEAQENIHAIFKSKETSEYIRMHPILKKSKTLLLYRNILLKDISSETETISKPKKFFYNKNFSNEEIKNQLVSNWVKYLKLEQMIAKFYNKPAFFFIQPSQYNPGSKAFSAEENATVLNQRYANSTEYFQTLRRSAKNIGNVHDLVDVFKNEKGTIYTDDCCHVNEKGNDILASEIFRIIKGQL